MKDARMLAVFRRAAIILGNDFMALSVAAMEGRYFDHLAAGGAPGPEPARRLFEASGSHLFDTWTQARAR